MFMLRAFVYSCLFTFIFAFHWAWAQNTAVLVPVLSLLLEDEVDQDWGAEISGQEARVDRTWMAQFDGITPIVVGSPLNTLEAAIEQCTEGAYCVIEIDQLQLNDTFYLDRSKTKLVGVSGNKVTYHDTGETGAFIELAENTQEIIIDGLHLDGESLLKSPVFGLIVYGENIHNVALLNNHIHHLNSDDDAHGIAVYGIGAGSSSAISNIIIDNNDIHDMRTGSSESIAINGNVSHWEITNNLVSRVNNIAIDAIGGEGTAPTTDINGRIFPSSWDAARYGLIRDNVVEGMTTLDNPAYGSEHSWAGAIYIDGAHHVAIMNNQVTGAEWAYDIGAENCVRSRHILLQDNQADSSYFGDFILGGYAEEGFDADNSIECDPHISIDDNEGHGYVQRVTVKGNQFNTPASAAPFVNRIELLYRIRQSVVIQAGVQAEHVSGVVLGDENSIRIED